MDLECVILTEEKTLHVLPQMQHLANDMYK